MSPQDGGADVRQIGSLTQGSLHILCGLLTSLAESLRCKSKKPLIVEVNGLGSVGFPALRLVGVDGHVCRCTSAPASTEGTKMAYYSLAAE
jgi:hypothetical protein